jgi:selenophosphate synthetase-related protein
MKPGWIKEFPGGKGVAIKREEVSEIAVCLEDRGLLSSMLIGK